MALSFLSKPFHLWKKDDKGTPPDYQIINEFGQVEWASSWCRRVWAETRPRPVLVERRKR